MFPVRRLIEGEGTPRRCRHGLLLVLGFLVCLSTPFSAVSGVGQGRCHCPCKVKCGGGVECNCLTHPDDCQDCHCIGGGKNIGEVLDILLGLDAPQGTMSHAPWFRTDFPRTIQVGFEARDALTREILTFPFRMHVVSWDPLLYEASDSFDAAAYAQWAQRVDRHAGIRVYVAAKSDPGSWTITDGNVAHVSESLDSRFFIRNRGDTEWTEVYYAESTPAWEAWTYLRSMASLIPDDAFAEGISPSSARQAIYSRLDTWQLVVAASDYEQGRKILATLADELGQWLRPGHEAASASICAVRKIHRLLTPGEALTCQP